MKTEIEIETALYKVLQDAPVETVIRCLGKVCHDIGMTVDADEHLLWAEYSKGLIKLAD